MKYRIGKVLQVNEDKDDWYLNLLKYLLYGSVILYLGRDLFIPVSFALLISFVLYPICAWLEAKGVKRIAAIFISLFLLLVLAGMVFGLLAHQITLFTQEWPSIQVKIKEFGVLTAQWFRDYFSISVIQQERWLQELAGRVAGFVVEGAPSFVSASVYFAVLLILVPVFSALILYYRHRLVEIVFYLFPTERKEDLKNLLHLSIDAYYNFIKGMAIVYIVVGILNSLGLLMIGVPHPILFGFIASVLTFIPYLGIMVGSLLPVAMAWVTYDSVWYPLGVVLVFTVVQYMEANIIFPLAVSNRLNINALATLIAIVAGGIIWGVSGMILFVPFVGIIKLVADRHPKMKVLSLMIGT